jgi:hypothetical protein
MMMTMMMMMMMMMMTTTTTTMMTTYVYKKLKTGEWSLINIYIGESYNSLLGHAMTRWSPTAETRAQSRVSPCAICGGLGHVFPSKFHSTAAPLTN